MRFIDYLLKEPIYQQHESTVLAGSHLYDKTLLLSCSPVPFVVDNVAKELIKDVKPVPGGRVGLGGFRNTVAFTEIGQELLFTEGKLKYKAVQIFPPYPSCFFEYRPHWREAGILEEGLRDETHFEGVWIFSGDAVDRAYGDVARERYPETKYILLANVFNRYTAQNTRTGHRITANEHQGAALLLLNGQGDLILFQPEKDMLNRKEVLVALASMMLMGTKIATPVQATTVPPTRKQRRQARRHETVAQPALRFWTLKLNVPEQSDVPSEHGKGGWIVAWHRVRGHLRHLKSGKVVTVKAHTRGNPLMGVVVKDYELVAQ
jgi:hypothetical protein